MRGVGLKRASQRLREMHDPIKLRFKIGAFKPDTIPMERLAQYMGDLAAMLGDPNSVHFVELVEGSTNLVHTIEHEAFPKVSERLVQVARGDADVVYMAAYRAINRKLKEDNADGALIREDQPAATILEFPGVKVPDVIQIEPVRQNGTIDGAVISLGGRDKTVPVRVQRGDTIYRCSTSRQIARQLGAHIFGSELRFVGVGIWLRDEEGVWSLKVFEIQSFELLDTTPLDQVVSDLRAIRGDWSTVSDAWEELQELRDGDEETH